MDHCTPTQPDGLVRTAELVAGVAFAPLPELLGDLTNDWRPVSELGRTGSPDSVSPGPYSVAAALAAELTDCPAGPHAVHALRSLTREVIWSQSASVLLTGSGVQFTPDQWLLRRVGDGPGSVRHGLPLEAAAPVSAELGAQSVVALVTPLVEAIREQTQVGRRTLWSYVIDTASLAMIVLARQLGQDRRATWHVAERWAEMLFAAGVPRLSQPELVRYGDRDSDIWAVRGACCLDFKDPDHGFCLTCPVLDHQDRAVRWQASDLAVPPPSAGA